MNVDLLHKLVGKEKNHENHHRDYEVIYPFMEKKLVKRIKENNFLCSFFFKKSKKH